MEYIVVYIFLLGYPKFMEITILTRNGHSELNHDTRPVAAEATEAPFVWPHFGCARAKKQHSVEKFLLSAHQILFKMVRPHKWDLHCFSSRRPSIMLKSCSLFKILIKICPFATAGTVLMYTFQDTSNVLFSTLPWKFHDL